MNLKKQAVDERPRERLSLYGVQTLSNAELLAVVLSRGTKRVNALDIARDILSKYRLRELNTITYQELEQLDGIGFSKACSIIAAMELGRRAQYFNPIQKKTIGSPTDAYAEIKHDISLADQEKLVCLFLNSRDALLNKKTLFVGTINRQLISVRDIAKEALKLGAVKVILAHNHPSEDLTPSNEDTKATEKIKEALSIFDIDLIDHLIISGNNFLSFKEKGLV
ncbi:MAG: RadC family protein [Candidatus Woesearchaeota archaeon]